MNIHNLLLAVVAVGVAAATVAVVDEARRRHVELHEKTQLEPSTIQPFNLLRE